MKCPICNKGEMINISNEFGSGTRCNICYYGLTGPPGTDQMIGKLLDILNEARVKSGGNLL